MTVVHLQTNKIGLCDLLIMEVSLWLRNEREIEYGGKTDGSCGACKVDQGAKFVQSFLKIDCNQIRWKYCVVFVVYSSA